MKKLPIFSLLFLFILTNSAFAIFYPVSGIESTQTKRVIISNLNPSLIYVASKNSLYESKDQGESYEKVAVFKDEEVLHIFFDPYLAGIVYVVTSRHLYQIKDGLKQLYRADDDQQIFTAIKYKGVFYLGTNKGLYYASQDLMSWQRLKGSFEISVYDFSTSKEDLLIASSHGIYVLDSDYRLKRLFILRNQAEDDYKGLVVSSISLDIFKDRRIWLGTSRGLFKSDDYGKTWNKFFVEGVDNLYINSLVQTKLEEDVIYLAAKKGLFKVNTREKTSKQVFEGLYSANVNWIEFSKAGEIYLATAKGVFKNKYFSFPDNNKPVSFFDKEPLIVEVQQAALRYNEVHPEKIRQWRNALRFRGLFPDVSLDYDKTINYDSGSDRYYTGPRDWGISFSWDVGDLIWDRYQDDIDTRSRLNTQLRLDILDEINRVYFERLRLKRQLLISDLNEEEQFKQELRLEELTAIIDGYTGGFFSKRARNQTKAN